MNKEFRAWDKASQKMSYPSNSSWIYEHETSDGFSLAFPFENSGSFIPQIIDTVVQQWTNALDKNNNKIFEGDIVLFDNPDPYDGEDKLTKIVGYNSRVMGFRLYNFTHEINKYGGEVFFPEQVEVIGNIFEGAIKDGINYGEYLKEK